jgi:hypothetical protein
MQDAIDIRRWPGLYEVAEDSPVRRYRTVVDDSGNLGYVNRLLVGTATTGSVRMEWVCARYGQVIPTNWSMVQALHFMDGYVPLRYQVADAQNLIVRDAVNSDFEWLLLLEHDTMPPPDAFIRFNEYMRRGDVPVVSGLYYTKTTPPEPLVYRGRGNGAYDLFALGDLVWCDGVPTGCLLIHCAILREIWKDSEEYEVRSGVQTRRVFETPMRQWYDPESGQYNAATGTSDLEWCTRVMQEEYFARAGWDAYQEKEYPFLVDTNILCSHIDQNGVQFPGELYLHIKRQFDAQRKFPEGEREEV